MAITQNDENNQQGTLGSQFAPNQDQAFQPDMNQQRPAFSFHTGGLFGSPIGRGLGSDVYNKLKAKLTEIFKSTTDKNAEIALIDLDNVNEPALVYSSIIIAMRFKDRPEVGVSYYTILLEDTGEKLQPIFESINGQQVEILRVTSDAFDNVLTKKAYDKVCQVFNTTNVSDVDGCILPADFNVDDNRAVYNIALNAGWACGTDLEVRTPGFHDLNLVDLKNESTLNVTLSFAKKQLADAVGSPMRSDVLINFDSRKNTQGNKFGSVNSGDKEVKISEVSGFIDLVLMENSMNPFNAYAPQQPGAYGQMNQSLQKYGARLIITNLANNHIYSMSAVLLALATSVSVKDDNNWVQAFRPLPTGSKEIDMGDIGALNIDANLTNDPSGFGVRIDTKSDSFRLEDLGQLAAAMIKQGLMISMDCPEYGPQSWYLSVFSAASMGSSQAYQVIYHAANVLTNGLFGEIFQMGSAMFTDVNNRIHNGYYIDKNGMKRDIRDIDHLAVCNLVGERNPQFIKDWSDTFLKTQYPQPLRLAARKRMIQNLTGESAVFTGFSQRVTFTGEFMNALTNAIARTGLAVRVTTPLSGADINSVRGTATFANAALMQPGSSFMSAGGYNYQSNNQFGQNPSQRWS